MILETIWHLLEDKVFTVPSTEVLFNQYKDVAPAVDLPDAASIRRANLKNYLRSFTSIPHILVVGEAPGAWGCRFSGVPFTSEVQLSDSVLPFVGHQSSRNSSPYSEVTAKIFWHVMLPYHPRFLAWNCVPFHPHKEGAPLSIRNPTRNEIRIYSSILLELIQLLNPRYIVAIGQKSKFALDHLGVTSLYVRHPSRGGAKAFKAGIEHIVQTMCVIS